MKSKNRHAFNNICLGISVLTNIRYIQYNWIKKYLNFLAIFDKVVLKGALDISVEDSSFALYFSASLLQNLAMQTYLVVPKYKTKKINFNA